VGGEKKQEALLRYPRKSGHFGSIITMRDKGLLKWVIKGGGQCRGDQDGGVARERKKNSRK